jgi:glycosyltransferase involved in cell wall biosynthesis
MELGRSDQSGTFEISVGIPAYSRPLELAELLRSIYDQSVLPAEVVICEDESPERLAIRSIVHEWRERFARVGCPVRYRENECNLGYDGNLRAVVGASNSPWVMVIGNDDLLLEGCIGTIERFIRSNSRLRMISRSFVRFKNNIHRPIGVSRVSSVDSVFSAVNSSAKMIFRTCGFVGGLTVDRDWASALSTDRYDGTLYYQIYLASVAFCEGGIGYISRPIVGGRGGNPPLFGSAAAEQDVHVPGSYTPKGRARMWASVLQIAKDVGQRYRVNLSDEIRHELEVRQSFHVFEMMAGADKQKLSELRGELKRLGLFNHPVPRTLYLLDLLLGSNAAMFYSLARRVLQ